MHAHAHTATPDLTDPSLTQALAQTHLPSILPASPLPSMPPVPPLVLGRWTLPLSGGPPSTLSLPKLVPSYGIMSASTCPTENGPLLLGISLDVTAIWSVWEVEGSSPLSKVKLVTTILDFCPPPFFPPYSLFLLLRSSSLPLQGLFPNFRDMICL